MVYGEEGKFVYRASAAGNCIRALVAARLGFDPLPTPELLERAGNEGRLHEPAVIDYLSKLGWKIYGQQKEIEIPLPTAVIRGHIDGIGEFGFSDKVDFLTHNGYTLTRDSNGLTNPVLVEVKTMSKSVFSRWESRFFEDEYFHRYAVQTSLYMYATGYPMLMAVKRRDDGLIKTYYYPEPPLKPGDVIRRILAAEKYAQAGDLPKCDKDDFFCSYKYLCDKPQIEAKQQVTINEVAVQAWAKKYNEANSLKKKYEALEKEARQYLLGVANYTPSELGQEKVKGLKIISGKFQVSIYEGERESVSVKDMRDTFGDVVNDFVKTSRYPVVRVTERS